MGTNFNTLDAVMMPEFSMHFLETTESYTAEETYDDNEIWDEDDYSQENNEYPTEHTTAKPIERPSKVYENTTIPQTTLPPKSEAATTKGRQNKATTKAETYVVNNDGYYTETATAKQHQQNNFQNYSQYNEYAVNVAPDVVVTYEANGMPEVSEEYATIEAYAVYGGAEDTYTTGEYKDNSTSFFGLALIFVIVLVVAALATTIAILVKNNKKKPETVIVPDQSSEYIPKTDNQPDNHSVQGFEAANNVWCQDNDDQPYKEYPGYNAQNSGSGSDVEQ